jgi:molecular chaperone GrpE
MAPADNNSNLEENDTDENGHLDENASDQSALDDLALKLTEAEQQAKENYERLLRVSAEFENYKKRTAREMQETIKYANEKIIGELLTVVDNLQRAIDSASQQCGSDDPLVRGVDLTLNETLKLLERYYVSPIVAIGQPFDPNFHQAMMQEEVEDQPANTVVRELQKGYMIHDRLLRPALVAVSKTADTKNEP